MDLTGIISVSGKTGLFKVVAQSKSNIIIESLIDNKRVPAYSTDRISALEDISIYTYDEDFPLREVYKSIAKKTNCGEAPSHKESLKTLEIYLEEILPNYDQERVYPSDIKKIFQWYNLLHKAGLITLEEKVEEKVEVEAPEAVEKVEKPKAAKKKVEAKEAPKAAAKKVTEKKATEAKKPAAKKPEAKKTTKKEDK
ncbi:MAG TPA: DUF5606 domain-containing protein [Brumimicrobium sp.]|nr:DUF5606 domain-containing protein [Brumimicrobium sp.]